MILNIFFHELRITYGQCRFQDKSQEFANVRLVTTLNSKIKPNDRQNGADKSDVPTIFTLLTICTNFETPV